MAATRANSLLPHLAEASFMQSSVRALEKRYKAFISYSHADNQAQGRKWADWLHHSLETYQIPAELVGRG